MFNRELIKLATKKIGIMVLPVLVAVLVSSVLSAQADPCDIYKPGGSPVFVDSCDD